MLFDIPNAPRRTSASCDYVIDPHGPAPGSAYANHGLPLEPHRKAPGNMIPSNPSILTVCSIIFGAIFTLMGVMTLVVVGLVENEAVGWGFGSAWLALGLASLALARVRLRRGRERRRRAGQGRWRGRIVDSDAERFGQVQLTTPRSE